MPFAARVQCVLFDLDGTLLDPAPDLVTAVNRILEGAGVSPRSAAELTPLISQGAPAMLRHGLGDRTDGFEALLQRMLDFYERNVAVKTRLYDGMDRVLEVLERAEIPWGIVTNKLARFTDPLVRSLGLHHRASCVISGDTTGQRKPHPLPVLEACRRIVRHPSKCLFVGDALSDIQAAQRAGMAALAATYGYLAVDDEPAHWAADGLIGRPEDLLRWLGR